MQTTNNQLMFLKRGLNLKEFFVFELLKNITPPVKLATILSLCPILSIKERQLKSILTNLETAGLLYKTKSPKGLFFILSFVNRAKNRTYIKVKKCKKPPDILKILCKKPHISHFNSNKYKLNKYKQKSQEVVYKSSSKEHLNFLKNIKERFKASFPLRSNFISEQLPANFNISLLIDKIKASPFLIERDFLGLNWCIKNYTAIISDYYAPFSHSLSSEPKPTTEPNQRQYSAEFFDSLYDI